jgi:RNA polymerase sigma-70 factor (ECF subfamily)
MQRLRSEAEIERAVKTCAPDIVRLAFAYVKNRADAQDIAQEVYLSYMLKSPPFADEAHEKAWLIRVTVNKCRDFLKSAWNRRRKPLPEELPAMPEEESHLLQAVLALDEMYRLPVYLHYFLGYSIREAAALLRMNPSTVGTRLDRGRRLLKERLGEHNG